MTMKDNNWEILRGGLKKIDVELIFCSFVIRDNRANDGNDFSKYEEIDEVGV